MPRRIEDVPCEGIMHERGVDEFQQPLDDLAEAISARTASAYRNTTRYIQHHPRFFMGVAATATVLLVSRWAFRRGVISVRVVWGTDS